MKFFLKGWPWVWLLLATLALMVENGFQHLLGTAIFGLLLGSIYSMVGLYLNSHLHRGRWKLSALGAFLGALWGVYSFWGTVPVRVMGPVFLMTLGLLLGCLVQSLAYLIASQRPPVPQPSKGSVESQWRSLGLTRITGQGAQVLAVQGVAEPIGEFEHGGDTDQYLEFAPGDRTIASWTPGKLQIFSTADRSSLGVLKDRGLLVATGHENGRVKLWSREQLPTVRWLQVAT